MKITISFDDKEVMSFDILVLLIIIMAYCFYLAVRFFYNINSKNLIMQNSNIKEEEDEVHVEEMKISEKNDNNENNIVTEKSNKEINGKTSRTEEEKKTLEKERIEKQNAQKLILQKKEEEWMVIRNGKQQVKKLNKNY